MCTEYILFSSAKRRVFLFVTLRSNEGVVLGIIKDGNTNLMYPNGIKLFALPPQFQNRGYINNIGAIIKSVITHCCCSLISADANENLTLDIVL